MGVAASLSVRDALLVHIDMAFADQCRAADCDSGPACHFVQRAQPRLVDCEA